jgi:hypothetical protein
MINTISVKTTLYPGQAASAVVEVIPPTPQA